MNTQNILKFYGSKLDVKLDSSEFYDFELSKVDNDYNAEILDLTQPITYSTLKIDDNLENFDCNRTTITLVEYDNTINDELYSYSGFSTTLDFENFCSSLDNSHKYRILNNDVYTYIDVSGKTHYMYIDGFNNPISIDLNMGSTESEILSGFTGEYVYNKCIGKLENPTSCCGITPKFGVKPWAYQFIQPEVNDCTEPIIQRRTEKGWTIDFIFNRESQLWSEGGKFYYFGTGGDSDLPVQSDNSLSFGFTNDGRIEWTATRYSGYCDNVSGYSESYYYETDTTPVLCTTGDTKDFNITIVFDRYKRLTNCDIENKGGWNDLLGWKISDYENIEVTSVTSNQIVTYESSEEFLNKKWADDKINRLGVLKIYLNGKRIYKKDNWEEIVPSNRGSVPFIQSWGGSQQEDINHRGVCCFNIKSIKYYEEPLDFLHVRHNFLTRYSQYDFFICGEQCQDEPMGIHDNGIVTESGDQLITENNYLIVF